MANKPNPNNNQQGIAIQQLLAAPFIAAASANSVMAKKQTIFLMESCFDRDEDENGDEIYHPKMINMTMTKNTLLPAKHKNDKARMEQINTIFQIPILTLIPFNSLCVTDVNVKFDLEIVSQQSGSTSVQKNTKGSEDIELKGTVSYDSSEKKQDQYQRRNSSKLSVEMSAGSIPLPVGVTTILEIYTKNINPTSLDKKPVE